MSREGTTQGDPIAMPLYATAVLPLLRSVATEGVTQAWYADDACAGGKMAGLRLWWDGLAKNGPQYGYYLNSSKSILLVKPEFYDEAIQIFKGVGVHIKSDGVRYLGIAISSPAYTIQFLNETVQSFLVQLSRLSEVAASQPQAAYSAYVHGLRSKWSFLWQTMPQMSSALLPLDRMVSEQFIPSILGRQINDFERQLLALPCHFGGLGIVFPSSLATQYDSSRVITALLTQRVMAQEQDLGDSVASVLNKHVSLVSHHKMELLIG